MIPFFLTFSHDRISLDTLVGEFIVKLCNNTRIHHGLNNYEPREDIKEVLNVPVVIIRAVLLIFVIWARWLVFNIDFDQTTMPCRKNGWTIERRTHNIC